MDEEEFNPYPVNGEWHTDTPTESEYTTDHKIETPKERKLTKEDLVKYIDRKPAKEESELHKLKRENFLLRKHLKQTLKMLDERI